MTTGKVWNSVFVSGAFIDATLAGRPTRGKNLLEPMKSFAVEHGLPFKILEVHESEYEAEVHRTVCDLWCCLEGEASFTCGGELIALRRKDPDGHEDPNELRGVGIRGGRGVTLHPGDWLWIPAGEPHQHTTKGTARLLIVRLKAES